MKRMLILSPPEDRSGRALTLGTAIAERFGADVDVLRVLEEGQNTAALDAKTHDGDSLRDVLLRAEAESLESAIGPLRSTSRTVDVEVEWGVPWESVTSRVKERGIDLVVKPAGGLSRSGSVFFGSTALHLFRRCPCPVWVVGESAELPERILAAVDPTDEPHRRRLAERVLHWSDEIADWTCSSIDVATAWSTPDFERAGAHLAAEARKRLRNDAFEATSAELDALLGTRREPIGADRLHLLEGSPTEVLPMIARQSATDLIVMGTLSRPDRAGDLLGATAETVVRQVRCSVLTVPPNAKLAL
ncbi:MAG: universal stress protein [bacterium]|nr:universal stress protein [bacterium]